MCYEKYMFKFGIIGYVWACFAVSGVTFVGTFGSVNESLFCGVCGDFRSKEIVWQTRISTKSSLNKRVIK